MRPIVDVAKDAGIDEEFLEVYGKHMAKINLNIRKKLGKRKGKLILVTTTLLNVNPSYVLLESHTVIT